MIGNHSRKKFLFIFVCAMFVGGLSIAPHVLATRALGDAYNEVPFFYQDNEYVYMSRVQDILDGHETAGSPVLYDYKETKALILPTGEYVYAVLAFLFGVTVPTVSIIAKFLFPAILFLLVYAYTASLLSHSTEKKVATLVSVAVSFLVTLGYELVNVGHVWGIITGNMHEVSTSIWTRPVNPITGAFFLWTFLLCLYKTAEDRKRWLWIVAGIACALMPGYIFSFGLAMLVLSFFFLSALLRKDGFIWKRCLGIVGIVGLLNAPYWILAFRSLGDGGGLRNGLLHTHEPLGNTLLFATLGVLGVFFYLWQRKGRVSIYTAPWWLVTIVVLVVSGIIGINQHVLTGLTIWPHHFVQYTIPFCFTAVCVGLYYLARQYGKLHFMQFFAIATIGVVIIFSFRSIQSYVYAMDDFRDLQRYGDAFTWLNQNAPKDCVVLPHESYDRLAWMIPAFTHCNTYTSAYTFFGVPYTRVQHNYLVQLRMRGVTEETVRAYLETHHDELRIAHFRDWEELFRHFEDPWLMKISDYAAIDAWVDTLTEEVIVAYQDFLEKDFTETLTEYRIDYVLWDENSKDVADPTVHGIFEEVAAFEHLVLYRISHD